MISEVGASNDHLAATTCAQCGSPVIYSVAQGSVVSRVVCPPCAIETLAAHNSRVQALSAAAVKQLGAALEDLRSKDERAVRRRVRLAIRRLERGAEALGGKDG